MNSENTIRKPNVFDSIDNSISNANSLINELENSLGMMCEVLGVRVLQPSDGEDSCNSVQEAPQSKIHRLYDIIGRLNERLSSAVKYSQSIRMKIDS